MRGNRNLLVFCPEVYDRQEFVSTPQGVATTEAQPQEHRWHQHFEIVQYNHDGDRPSDFMLGPVGRECGRCLSRLNPAGEIAYTDSAEVERQEKGEVAPPKLLVPRH
ncbi:hypothetical protein LCGC14_0826270 [marine sediment metagenome]|uniref:Uncharacterized protein n=1 Tax=marine sediment metagenome TaxID=412755 RepID=A0A0F9PLZ1_9ZZZZ